MYHILNIFRKSILINTQAITDGTGKQDAFTYFPFYILSASNSIHNWKKFLSQNNLLTDWFSLI